MNAIDETADDLQTFIAEVEGILSLPDDALELAVRNRSFDKAYRAIKARYGKQDDCLLVFLPLDNGVRFPAFGAREPLANARDWAKRELKRLDSMRGKGGETFDENDDQ